MTARFQIVEQNPNRLLGVRAISLCSFLFFLSIFLCPGLARAEKVSDLKPQGCVNDFAGVLRSGVYSQITALCTELLEKTGAALVIVTIQTLDGDTAQNFAHTLYQKWGVGKKGDDRGVLVLLAVNDHQYWTEVGYGLEPILPDGKVGGFGREMRPYLQQADYSQALALIASRIAGVIAQDRGVTLNYHSVEPPALDRPEPRHRSVSLFRIIVYLLLFSLLIGRGGSFLGGMFLGGLFGGMGRRGGWGDGGGGWGGGGFGGGGGGGGFGGFGGGSSGGGGAGGSW
ncbi:MAG TPA: TPM domain-containing protein [Candidatus Dormibacteraeota bacterium]|nr:TPM domain-containing protein [Candidatus Dormibacteraeota bacterium]